MSYKHTKPTPLKGDRMGGKELSNQTIQLNCPTSVRLTSTDIRHHEAPAGSPGGLKPLSAPSHLGHAGRRESWWMLGQISWPATTSGTAKASRSQAGPGAVVDRMENRGWEAKSGLLDVAPLSVSSHIVDGKRLIVWCYKRSCWAEANCSNCVAVGAASGISDLDSDILPAITQVHSIEFYSLSDHKGGMPCWRVGHFATMHECKTV